MREQVNHGLDLGRLRVLVTLILPHTVSTQIAIRLSLLLTLENTHGSLEGRLKRCHRLELVRLIDQR